MKQFNFETMPIVEIVNEIIMDHNENCMYKSKAYHNGYHNDFGALHVNTWCKCNE